MYKYGFVSLIAAMAFPVLAHADLCSSLQPYLRAIEDIEDDKIPDRFSIGQGETTCRVFIDDFLDIPIAGCYWDNNAVSVYTEADLSRTNENLKKCSFLKYEREDKFDGGSEHVFFFEEWTTLYAGFDKQGLYIEIEPDF